MAQTSSSDPKFGIDRRYAVVLAVLLVLAVIGSSAAFLVNRDGGNPISPQSKTAPGAEAPQSTSEPGERVQAVVSSHALATEAGIEVLGKGGSAADASVAVAATLSVVEPWFSSVLGGGTWALYYEAEASEVTSLDGVGPVGSKASLADYRPKAGTNGMHQAIVPGAWDGWMRWLEQYGELELGEVLAPAIRIAREGYPVSTEMDEWLERSGNSIRNRAPVAAIYRPNGDQVEKGDTVRQTAMADTFEALVDAYDEEREAGRGEAFQAARDYFYRGPIADEIVDFSNRNGGYLTKKDFADFEAEIVDPISVEYKDGVRVFQNPPNSQGIAMLLALNTLKGYDFSGASADDPLAVHRQIEAMKLAMADRYHHVGDPDRTSVPVKDLLSDKHAERQRARIDPQQALSWPIADRLERDPKAHTTTFQVTDKEGNAASVTTSLGAQFLVAGDTGIHMNQRMRFLSLEPGNPNVLTPGFKPRHTSAPYLALKDGKPYVLGGNTGVDTQPQGQMQQFLNVVEFGLTPQQAIDQPRWVSRSFPASTVPHAAPNELGVERSMSRSLRNGLEDRGHDLATGDGTWGSASMILLGPDGRSAQAAAESRVDVSRARVIAPE